ncbi:MAG: NAD(P)-dependent oxidoreductase [Proteobacteria bacterium]|nr:NAD(P)-dependent oxidoreductase [Pseudomonadota bacterium]
MRILLTGGSGFLGSALARHFDRAGHELVLLLRPRSSPARLANVRCRVARATSDADIAALVGEVRPDAVVHTACSYGRGGEGAVQIADANLRLGLTLLQALRAVEAPVTFINTGTALAADVSAYALSKHQFVPWGRMLADASLRFVNLRLQHLYGPGDDRSKFTTQVLHACHAHEPRLALTAGEQARDFIHVDDAVSAYDTVLAHAGELPAFDEIDVGSGRAPTIREFVEAVHALTASRTRLDFGALPYRPNEAMHCRADTARLEALGWRARWSLRDGLQHTIEQEFPA